MKSFDTFTQRYKMVVLLCPYMASEGDKKRPSASESLVKATVAVLDNAEYQAHFNRASKETSRLLGAFNIGYIS